jgi:hypothetical protein
MKANALIGKIFGSWEVVGLGRTGCYVLCRCSCGMEREVYRYDLAAGKSTKCRDCRRLERAEALKQASVHAHARVGEKSPTYRTWVGMRSRCNNPKVDSWAHYGGRGIKVCERWESFENFLADMGLRPSLNHWIERYDVDKGYSPDNCGWELKEVQPHNKTTTVWVEVEGRRVSLATARRLLGISRGTTDARIAKGLSGGDLIAAPLPHNEVSALGGKARQKKRPAVPDPDAIAAAADALEQAEAQQEWLGALS